MFRLRSLVSRPGLLVSRPGRMVSRPGLSVSRPGRLVLAVVVAGVLGGVMPGPAAQADQIGRRPPSARTWHQPRSTTPPPSTPGSTCPAPGGAVVANAQAPFSAEVVFSGHGWGHGLGMSQYGAQGAARLGCSAAEILHAYYRGVDLATRTMTAPVKLRLASTSVRTTVHPRGAAVTWHAPNGMNVPQPADSVWQVVRQANSDTGVGGLAVLDDRGTRQMWVADGDDLNLLHAGIAVDLRTYGAGATRPSLALTVRWGKVRWADSVSGTAVSEWLGTSASGTAVQKYLWGLAEVPVRWPQQALRAQVIAARTYLASKYSTSLAAYVIGVTPADQEYEGVTREDQDTRLGGGWHQAVIATAGQVLLDAGRRPISAMYSSSMGGWTEDRAYSYGASSIDYLRALDDSTWDLASDDPHRSWAVGLTLHQVAVRLGFSSITSLALAPRGSTARDDGLIVAGVSGGYPTVRSFTGMEARARLDLLSPGFTIGIGPGGTTAQPLVGDWNGDGASERGWFHRGLVSVRTSSARVQFFPLPRTSGTAVVGDFDGDGKDTVSLFTRGSWFLYDRLGGTASSTFGYGHAGDQPVVGRWPGAAHDAIGVVRGTLWMLRLTATPGPFERWFDWSRHPGQALAADWDGDGFDGPVVRAGTTWTFGAAGQPGTGRRAAPVVTHTLDFGPASAAAVFGRWGTSRREMPGLVQGWQLLRRTDLGSSTPLRGPFGA